MSFDASEKSIEADSAFDDSCPWLWNLSIAIAQRIRRDRASGNVAAPPSWNRVAKVGRLSGDAKFVLPERGAPNGAHPYPNGERHGVITLPVICSLGGGVCRNSQFECRPPWAERLAQRPTRSRVGANKNTATGLSPDHCGVRGFRRATIPGRIRTCNLRLRRPRVRQHNCRCDHGLRTHRTAWCSQW